MCLAPDYALVHESVERPFVDALAKHMTAMYNPDGKGFEKSEYLPRIVNVRHFQRIKALLDDAVAKGAKVECGGQTDAATCSSRRPSCPSSTRMRIMQEEIFGPIICVVPFREREEAVREIRSRPKPLGSYIFAKDRAAIDWFLAHTTSGSTVVNHNLIQSGTNPHLPFGGVNASGIGRLGGRYTFLECSNARAVVEDGKGLGDPNMMFPPYSDKYTAGHRLDAEQGRQHAGRRAERHQRHRAGFFQKSLGLSSSWRKRRGSARQKAASALSNLTRETPGALTP